MLSTLTFCCCLAGALVVQLLMAALTKTHTEIDDHVTYMRRPVKVRLSI